MPITPPLESGEFPWWGSGESVNAAEQVIDEVKTNKVEGLRAIVKEK
jgi:hypothetical protein